MKSYDCLMKLFKKKKKLVPKIDATVINSNNANSYYDCLLAGLKYNNFECLLKYLVVVFSLLITTTCAINAYHH